MLSVSSEVLESFLILKQKLTKKQRKARIRAEVILNARTTPNNVFITISQKTLGHVFYWTSKGRPQFSFLKFNNMFSLERMFVEAVVFLKRYNQFVFCIKLRGRVKLKPLARQLIEKNVPLYSSNVGNRKPFNGCKLPHTRRV